MVMGPMTTPLKQIPIPLLRPRRLASTNPMRCNASSGSSDPATTI